jgi:ribosome assembly protein RRB1
LGRITLWDLKEQLKAIESSASSVTYKKTSQKYENAVKPIFTFKGHLIEGYGLDWCSTEIGTIASGDCKGNIHIWRYSDYGRTPTWDIDQRPYSSHAPFSVEDLQWSPNERHVLASCSVDKRYF